MGLPILMADNLFSVAQYPSHVISAEEEPANFEAYKVGRASRWTGNYATATTANDPWYIQVVCDRIRGANCWILDRGHNLAGKAVTLVASQDNFSTSETILSYALPSASSAGRIDDPLGVRTEEGAHVQRFPMREAKYWRLSVSAMGSGLKPQIVGLWLGMAIELSKLPDMPFSEDVHDLVQQVMESDLGWIGGTKAVQRRSGTLSIRLDTQIEYDSIRSQVQGLFGAAVPTWLVVDSDQAERAMLVRRVPGSAFGFGYSADWWNLRRGQMAFVEHEPLVA